MSKKEQIDTKEKWQQSVQQAGLFERKGFENYTDAITDICFTISPYQIYFGNHREANHYAFQWAMEFYQQHKQTNWYEIEYLDVINEFIDSKIKEIEFTNPYRCAECGSLNIQEKAWVNSHTLQHIQSIVDNSSNLQCDDCHAHTKHIIQSDLMKSIQDWWTEETDLKTKEEVTGISLPSCDSENANNEILLQANNHWNNLTTEQKIAHWNKYK